MRIVARFRRCRSRRHSNAAVQLTHRAEGPLVEEMYPISELKLKALESSKKLRERQQHGSGIGEDSEMAAMHKL